jgi:hypothetical protein
VAVLGASSSAEPLCATAVFLIFIRSQDLLISSKLRDYPFGN